MRVRALGSGGAAWPRICIYIYVLDTSILEGESITAQESAILVGHIHKDLDFALAIKFSVAFSRIQDTVVNLSPFIFPALSSVSPFAYSLNLPWDLVQAPMSLTIAGRPVVQITESGQSPLPSAFSALLIMYRQFAISAIRTNSSLPYI